MATVRVTSEVSLNLDQLLSGVAQLDTDELRNFVERVSLMLAQRRAASLPELEASLLQSINQGLPEDIQQRYSELQTKLQNEAIAPEEHQELPQLIDVVEQADANRLKALVELAQLRGVTLPELMERLELQPLSLITTQI
ncbi:STAS/SEC14 domain-containing protein [filamentous cyanobacterium CCP3]|nr:STAS/SEC14 domain-containing protein [filamentous cyanobacterium CCP3]